MDIKVRTNSIRKWMVSLHLAQEDTAGLLQHEYRVFGTVDIQPDEQILGPHIDKHTANLSG